MNPLLKIKNDDKNLTWGKLEKYSGVKAQTLMLIANDKMDLEQIRLDTYYRIKKYLSVDLIDYIYNNK